MKLPRGFGKNYFSLNAITVTVNQISLSQNKVRVQDFHLKNETYTQEDELEELEELPILCSLQFSLKPCHCNCFFKNLTKKILKLFFCKKHPFDFHRYLHTDISPP